MSSFLITSVVSCTLYFDVLIIELFKICLVTGKNSGEGILSKVFFDVSRWSGKFLSPGGQMSRLVKKFSIYWGRRKICMMPVILMGRGGAKRWDHYCYYMRVANQKVEDIFRGTSWPLYTPCLKEKNVPFPRYFTSLY